MTRFLFLFLALVGISGARAQGLPTRDGVATLAPILARVMPAVVNIAVLQRRPEEQNPLLRDPFFRRFFGVPEEEEPQVAAGSGVIVDAAHGYVITNAHVVKDAERIQVTLRDNRRLPATLVGADPGTDIALVKVKPGHLVELKFGDSDALQVGDFVIAIGNPFGIGQTATSGIVSALGRSGLHLGGYEHFIQTDASINPGNSGGALVNLKGELVGINSAIIGPSGGNVGIGFAVPSVLAKAVMEQLIRYGEVRRGRLGITMADAPGGQEGALIAEVQPGSPAAAAGIEKGDIVIALDGRPVRGAADLRARLGVVPIGDTVELRLLHHGEQRTVSARIAPVQRASIAGGRTIPELPGARLQDVRRGNDRAVLVASVQADSPALAYGLREGDLIIGVNQRRVGSIAELSRRLRSSQSLALNVVRGDFLMTIEIR